MTDKFSAAPISHAHFAKGDTIVRAGDAGDCAYIIESGRVLLFVQRDGQMQPAGENARGAIIGEMALIGGTPSAFTYVADEDCTLLRISRQDFTRRIETADPILRMMMEVILHRYRNTATGGADSAAIPHFADLGRHLALADSSHADALRSLRMGIDLREALTRGDLTLYYQPIIDVQNMRLEGFEALIRWLHPERGMISPALFIPVAEESGMIGDITTLALDIASRDVRRIKSAYRADIAPLGAPFISVNLSVKDFAGSGIYQEVSRALKRHGANPSDIHLEITETLLMDEPEKARDALQKCRENGICVSIDDFGSGYSSLSYLHAFPIDTLKIDQSFIRSMRENAASLVLVKSIVALARNLNMKIVAEGVETREEARVLRDLGCHKCQGYWFGRPMPLEDACTFASTWQPAPLWDSTDA